MAHVGAEFHIVMIIQMACGMPVQDEQQIGSSWIALGVTACHGSDCLSSLRGYAAGSSDISHETTCVCFQEVAARQQHYASPRWTLKIQAAPCCVL